MNHIREYWPVYASFAGIILFVYGMGQFWAWRDRVAAQRFEDFTRCVYLGVDGYWIDDEHYVYFEDALSTADRCFEIHD